MDINPNNAPPIQSPPSTRHHPDRITFTLALIFFFLGIAALIILIIYITIWRPHPSSPPCVYDTDCNVGQFCLRNSCQELTCSSDSDCNGNGICLNNYCYAYRCISGNDCPTGMACVNNSCIQTGSECQNNTNCFHLTCQNQTCVQCLSNSDCPTGQGCFNNSCRYPYPGQTGSNMLFYPSDAQNNGNIIAPPGYFCSASVCGTGTNYLTCTGSTGSCPNSCPFCINSLCRCTPGQLYESCSNNSDCQSGVCSETTLGKICIGSGGLCGFNYTPLGCTGCCPTPLAPYCVNGLCTGTSLGAVCGNSGSSPDLCQNPSILTGVETETIPNGMGFFCINGRCQNQPGDLNQQCVPGSCQYLENTAFTCQQHRCNI